MNPMHPPRPETDAPRWKGLPVTCQGGCGDHGIPVMTEDGWRLPVHSMRRTDFPYGRQPCPGSLAAVPSKLASVVT